MSQTILWLLEGVGDFLFTKPSGFFVFKLFHLLICLEILRFYCSVLSLYMSLIFTYV